MSTMTLRRSACEEGESEFTMIEKRTARRCDVRAPWDGALPFVKPALELDVITGTTPVRCRIRC
eukprot:7253160-Pyramimonas_sp.AAC.1